jgi:hypothetical protein
MASEVEEMQTDVLAVSEAHGVTTILVINYPPSDPASSGGYVYQRQAGTADRSTQILATNDTLRSLWSSPSGSVWCASTLGRVWTTADVPWTNVDSDIIDFEVPESDHVWRYLALPRQERDDAAPNCQEIWGTSDDNVFVGSFGGVVYRWDGSTWTQHDAGLGGAIGRFGGIRADDVYACGYKSSILHFDGRGWRVIADPDGPGIDDILTGIAVTQQGDALICGQSRGGRVLAGNASGMSVVGRYGAPFIGMVEVDGRLIFAAGQSGVIEWQTGKVVTLRDDILPWSVSKGEGRLYFTETPTGLSVYSEFDLVTGTWRRLDF